MKRAYLLLVFILILTACEKEVNNSSGKNTPVVVEDINAKNTISTEISPITKGNLSKRYPDFLAEDASELSVWDFETAYTMCEKALSEYYKAIWNGSDIELDAYMDNKNLKQYMQMKISSQYELHLKNNLTDNLVTGVDIGARKVEFVAGDNDFFYLKLNARVKNASGSFAEPTEFLVQSIDGKLMIVDWYSNGKDSYDFTVRGENQTIDNPNIWNNNEWVEAINSRYLQ